VNKLYFGDNLSILREHPPRRTEEGLPGKRERPLYPDRAMGRATFKKAAVEDGGGEQGKLL